MDAPPRLRIAPLLVWGSALLALGLTLGAWIAVGRGNEPFGIDEWWSQTLAAGRTPVLLWFSYAMNWLGGGWFGALIFPIAVPIVLIVVKRPWAAGYFVAAELLSGGIVQILKHVFGRARPEDIIVVSDYGSFPSGHVANAATVAVALAIIFPRVWVMVVGAIWVVLMAFSRTYLGAHWLSDTAAGALVGTAAALFMAAAFAVPLLRERERRPALASA